MEKERTIIVDFESRSELDMKKVGAHVYAAHPSTEIFCMAYKFDEALPKIHVSKKFLHAEVMSAKGLSSSIRDFAPIADQLLSSKYVLEAHNAEFERAMWHHICHKRWGWPDLPIERWRCSAAKAAELGLPRKLDTVGLACDLPITKDKIGHRLMLKMCKPRKPLKAEKIEWLLHKFIIPDKKSYTDEDLLRAAREMPTLWHESAEDLIRLFRYCIQDVEAEHCLSKYIRPLSPREQQVWFLDQKINARGVHIDVEGAKAALELLKGPEDEMLEELKVITGGAITSTRKIQVTKDWLATQDVHLDNLQKDTVEKALLEDSLGHGVARRVLEIRQSLSKSSTKKFNAMPLRSSEDNRARGVHVFHGGHTGRWSGRGIQTQNMPRPEFRNLDLCVDAIKRKDFALIPFLWGDPAKVAASCTRSMICAAPGKDFICGDFSSIECVGISWLAKEEIILDAFRRKEDVYKLAATAIYPVRYEDVTKAQRRIGKVATLALGYQGAVGAFQKMATGYGVTLPDAAVKGIVKSWREKHTRIVAYWKENEYAVKRAIKTGKPVRVGAITWGVDGDYLFCKLPSGRLMAYYKPELRLAKSPYGMKESITYMGVDPDTTHWGRVHTYGGKLVENVVQGVARDMLVWAMFRVEAAGYPIVMHVHDELLTEVPKGFGSIEELENIMSVVPSWAEGCPLSAEGWTGNRYRK